MTNLETDKVVTGGKVNPAYIAYGLSLVVCILDVPNIEALTSFIEQGNMLGWETEVIPAEKMIDAIPRYEKMIAEMAGS